MHACIIAVLSVSDMLTLSTLELDRIKTQTFSLLLTPVDGSPLDLPFTRKTFIVYSLMLDANYPNSNVLLLRMMKYRGDLSYFRHVAISMLSHKDASYRGCAMDFCYLTDKEKSIKYYFAMLQDQDDSVVLHAISAIGRHGDRTDCDILAAITLQQRDQNARRTIVMKNTVSEMLGRLK